MAISDEARKNHDALFPGYVSTLKATDPELIEYFDTRRSEKLAKDGEPTDSDSRVRGVNQIGARAPRAVARIVARPTLARI